MQAPIVPAVRRRCAAARVAVVWLAVGFASAASPPAVKAPGAMVVSASPEATRAGLEILKSGGNAVDAAVATAFALSVTFPEAACLGGGGFLLLRRSDGNSEGLDFRETAPRALRAEAFLGPDGRPIPGLSLESGLAVGVPGCVAGLAEAHRRWGARSWSDLIRPAVRLAREGIVVSPSVAGTLREESERLGRDTAARALFFRGGAVLSAGDRLVQKDLAGTLKRIADAGAQAFYHGPIATALLESVRNAGGVLSQADLSGYAAVARVPLAGSYRGYRILAFPPPSSGGIALLQMLAMLEPFDMKQAGFGSSATIHRMAEVERRAFADRARWLGDPAFFTVPVRGLLDPAYLAARAAGIAPDRASRSLDLGAGTPPREGNNTTHLSVTDREGNAVALTVTLNSSFGCARVAPGTGILLNNEIDDFALAPGIPNQFGLVGGEANAVAPGKRPLSSMCPVIVETLDHGRRPLLVLGSPGGSTIITSVLQVLVNVIDHGMELQEAVDAPRFHHQWLPDRIDHESRAFPEDVAAALRARGHELHARRPIGQVAAIGIAADGSWLGAADPRRGGLAAGN